MRRSAEVVQQHLEILCESIYRLAIKKILIVAPMREKPVFAVIDDKVEFVRGAALSPVKEFKSQPGSEAGWIVVARVGEHVRRDGRARGITPEIKLLQNRRQWHAFVTRHFFAQRLIMLNVSGEAFDAGKIDRQEQRVGAVTDQIAMTAVMAAHDRRSDQESFPSGQAPEQKLKGAEKQDIGRDTERPSR